MNLSTLFEFLAMTFGGKLTATPAGLQHVTDVQSGVALIQGVVSQLKPGNTTTALQNALNTVSQVAAIAIAETHVVATPATPAIPTPLSAPPAA